jgi:hypothetical protein
MNVKLTIRYFAKEQRLEFRCPFCNQVQSWNNSVRIENDGKVSPDPKVAFESHVFGKSDRPEPCLVKPSIDEVEEYRPTATIED